MTFGKEMKIAIIISILLLCANFGAFLLCSEVETALIIASASTDQISEGHSNDPRLLKAKQYSGYATYLLLGAIPFFGILIGQCYRSYKTEQNQITKKESEQVGAGDAEEAF